MATCTTPSQAHKHTLYATCLPTATKGYSPSQHLLGKKHGASVLSESRDNEATPVFLVILCVSHVMALPVSNPMSYHLCHQYTQQ